VVEVRRTTGQSDKRTAEAILEQVKQTVIKQMTGRASALPFSVAADAWMKTKRRGKTDGHNYSRLRKHFKGQSVEQIGEDDWNGFVALNLYGAKPSHVNRVRATFMAILHRAGKRDIEIPREREVSDRVRFLTYEEQESLLSEYPEFIRGLFLVLCYQGLRLSEAMSLQSHHINLESRTLLVEKSKSGKRRILPIHDRVFSSFSPVSSRGYLFLNSKGERYADPRNVRSVHRRACKRAGIFDFTIHDWRHHWASRLTMAGASMPALMKLGGWSSERMVLRYASVSDQHITDTLMRLR
jgi:integrase